MNSPATARRGNRLSAAGMLVAVATTAVVIVHDKTITGTGWLVLIAGGALGSGAGLYAARAVQMTAMPQLVSIFNAVGGGAAALPAVALAALGFGVAMVLPIGGADMPVVISLLNAFTGTAVAMAGFVLDNTMLIIAGALVGASGSILTKLMADAMNRSIGNIVA